MKNSPYTICHCYNISDDRVEFIVIKHDCKTYKDVQKHYPVGTRCGSCVGDIQDICDKANEKK